MLLVFFLPGRCDLNCKYCYASQSPRRDIPLNQIISIIKELSAQGVFLILIEGGEPFLHLDIIEIIEKSLQYYPDLAILSNGTVLNKDIACELKRLKEKYPALKIQISLDSHIAKINNIVRGKGDIVIENIKMLADLGLEPTIATVIHKQNIKVADKIIDHFYPQVKKYHYMNLMPTKGTFENRGLLCLTKDESKSFWSSFAKKNIPFNASVSWPYAKQNIKFGKSTIRCDGCLAGWTKVNIIPNLDVIACPIADQSVMGNLNSESFMEIWQSYSAETIRKEPFPLCSNQY